MFAMKLWKEKVRFIGAGTIGIAAVWTLLMLLKPMLEGLKMSFKSFGGGAPATERTGRDLSPKTMIFWVLSMMLVLGIVLSLYRRFAHYRRHGLALVVVCIAFWRPSMAFGRRRLRLYGGFGRLVFQPDFRRGHRFHRHHFTGVVGCKDQAA